jgi:hypothetical protein
MRRSGQLMVVALGAGAVLAGCSSTSSGSGSHSAPAPSTIPSASSASSSASITATGTQGSTPPCTSDIRVIPGTVQGAAGHLALVLVFNNVSHTTTCEISGYPGVDLVTASGATVAHLARTLRGMAGGEPAGVTTPQGVVLAPGASASALAEASDVPQGGITDCGSYSLLITVPNHYVAVPGGTAMLPQCAAEIHPVVPGTSGGLN